jgi:4'-phosphopantetheinyl transferase
VRSLKLIDYSHLGLTNLQNEIHIWASDLDQWEIPGNKTEQKLPASERDKSERFRLEIIKTRYTKCHFLLRKLLGQYLGVDFYHKEFNYNEYGKPSLKNEKDNNLIYFNSSDSENICVFAFTKYGDVGIDVEKIHDLSDMGGIAESFFSSSEIKKLCSLPEHSKKNTFFKYWTRKEALLKAMGVGLSYPLDKLDVHSDEDNTSRVSITIHQNTKTKWKIQDINIFDGFSSALALKDNNLNCNTRLRYFHLA